MISKNQILYINPNSLLCNLFKTYTSILPGMSWQTKCQVFYRLNTTPLLNAPPLWLLPPWQSRMEVLSGPWADLALMLRQTITHTDEGTAIFPLLWLFGLFLFLSVSALLLLLITYFCWKLRQSTYSYTFHVVHVKMPHYATIKYTMKPCSFIGNVREWHTLGKHIINTCAHLGGTCQRKHRLL